MSEFRKFKKVELAEMRDYVVGENMKDIYISDEDMKLPSLEGGFIARDPKNHADQRYVGKAYAEVNFVESGKTLSNTTASQASGNVSDIQFWGDGDMFKLLCKASSDSEGWMKSTKAMQVGSAGCVVQVTTQQGDNVAESITFVPRAVIHDNLDGEGKVISRKLIYK